MSIGEEKLDISGAESKGNLNLKDLKPLESRKIDLSPYLEKKYKLEKYEFKELTFPDKKTGERKESTVLIFYTVPVGMYTSEGQEKELRASELFTVYKNEDGSWGWSTGENSKMRKFLKKLDIEHPSEAIGKEVMTNKREQGGSEYLGFYCH